MRLYDVDGYLKRMEGQNKAIVSATQSKPHVSAEPWKLDVETMFKLIHDKPITDNHFVVNFDRAYNWIGFGNKRSAKRHLMKNFDNGIDFFITDPDVPQTELIMLSADCFKSMCMTSNTVQGKLVREYYIELERNLRDGYLPLAGQVVQNYDAKNNVETEVLLKTTGVGVDGAPTWVGVWRDARTKQMMAGRSMVDMLKDKGVTDLRAYQVVENLHNQSVLGFKGWTKNWLKKNRIKVAAGAEAMTDSQVNLRKIFTERFCKLLTPIEAPNSDDVRRIAQEVHDYVERFATEMDMNTYMPTTDDRGRKVPCGKRVRELEGRQRRVSRKSECATLRDTTESTDISERATT
ncbi:hypothetical protein CYMTET_22556 [Cymbomonas tetramitiformis]|uniref:Uncharacterized protein n=1 Tax=Cymbomonas tetramitiformis TaxID=36881 RepID=A0AAE0FZN5_9CHLO|nr:hypothetical protein CYMTET_22556 [Cymbomonas tetramitiformis]